MLPILGGAISILGGVGQAVGDFFGGIFGSKPEDTSAAGFNAALALRNSGLQYPSKDWIVNAYASSGGSAENIDVLRKTYDQSTGTWSKGDWHGAITSMNPVTMSWFKGASERNDQVIKAGTAALSQPEQKPVEVKAQAAAFNDSKPSPGGMPSWLAPVAIGLGIVGALIAIGKAIFSTSKK